MRAQGDIMPLPRNECHPSVQASSRVTDSGPGSSEAPSCGQSRRFPCRQSRLAAVSTAALPISRVIARRA
jgi:hypothetical protein